MIPFAWVALVAIILAPAQATKMTWSVCQKHPDIPTPSRNDEVTALELSLCNLHNIKRKSFSNYTNLKILDLSSNRIEVIYKDWFGPALEYLNLSNNSIIAKDIQRDTFKIASNLKTIQFDRNNMNDAPTDLLKGTKIANLFMNNCNLREVPAMAFAARQSLEEMKLANNRISRLDDANTLSSFTSLLVLDLGNNTIEYLHKDVFQPLTQIMEIHLARNRIKYLPEGIFSNLTTLCTIDLSRNFIEYVPANAFHGVYALTLNISNNRISYLPAHFFSDLKSSGAQYLEILFRNNPWQCACLNQVLIEAKRLSVVYNCRASESDDCLSCTGNKPICVTNDFKCYRPNEIFQFYDSNIKVDETIRLTLEVLITHNSNG